MRKKAFKAEVNFRYKKVLEKNPELKKSFVKKRMQKARIKTAIGNLARSFEVRHVNQGRSALVRKEWFPNTMRIGGALVVVRGRESRPHGEGEQFKWLVWLINRP